MEAFSNLFVASAGYIAACAGYIAACAGLRNHIYCVAFRGSLDWSGVSGNRLALVGLLGWMDHTIWIARVALGDKDETGRLHTGMKHMVLFRKRRFPGRILKRGDGLRHSGGKRPVTRPAINVPKPDAIDG